MTLPASWERNIRNGWGQLGWLGVIQRFLIFAKTCGVNISKSSCGEEKGALGELAETPILINSGGKVQIIICHCVLKWRQIAAWFYKRHLLVLMKSKA